MNSNKLLGKAIDGGDLVRLGEILATGIDVNEPLPNGALPIVSAARNPSVLRILLEHGARVNQLSKSGDTALTKAMMSGASESVALLLSRGADPNLANGMGLLPLQLILPSGDPEAAFNSVKCLIQAKADVNRGQFTSPLMAACNASLETVRALVDAGADVNLVKPNGTPLHKAIELNKPDIVHFLLKNGADPTILTTARSSHPNLTSMELATKLKHSKIIKILENENPVALPQATVSPVTWAHIKDRLERELPRLYRSLRKGAKLQALEHLEHTVAATLPDEFKEFYLANDGQKSGTAAIAVLEDADYNLIPLKEIENVWLMQKSLLEQGEFKGLRGNSDQEIQNDWWNTGWVPFASDEAGDYICIDLAPTAAGTKGQVIATWHDSRRRLHLSNSFYTWLFEQLARLREET